VSIKNRRVLVVGASKPGKQLASVPADLFMGRGKTDLEMVVGANGLHSAVRELAFGEESRFVRNLGHGVSIGTVPNHLTLDRWELIYSTPGRTVNLYSTGKDADAKDALIAKITQPIHAAARAINLEEYR
jgi:2-polyprenyl-6-methoxyphenol hydroxylase-like FAD-dependent oxidoreductase